MFTVTVRQYVIILPVLVGTFDRDASHELAAVTDWDAFRIVALPNTGSFLGEDTTFSGEHFSVRKFDFFKVGGSDFHQ
jgi:hypothetical protein